MRGVMCVLEATEDPRVWRCQCGNRASNAAAKLGPCRLVSPSRLPLGDWAARAIELGTAGLVKPCGGCKQRQAKLNAVGQAIADGVDRLLGR